MSAAAVETSATARRVSVLVVPVDKKKVWVSVLNQLSHSDARIAAFAAEGEDHKLHVYQFGSPSLGYIPLNDAGTPGKFLDVFKTVRVGALEHRGGGGDVKERANAKAERAIAAKTPLGTQTPFIAIAASVSAVATVLAFVLLVLCKRRKAETRRAKSPRGSSSLSEVAVERLDRLESSSEEEA